MQTFKTLLLLVATSYATWCLGYYMGESNANEQIVFLEDIGMLEPIYIDDIEQVKWVTTNSQ